MSVLVPGPSSGLILRHVSQGFPMGLTSRYPLRQLAL